MLGFAVRRLLGMLAVLVAVSFFTFLVFFEVPGGDPAQRMAGKNATPQNVQNIRHDWGFDRPFYVQYTEMMKKTFVSRDLASYLDRQNVVDRIRDGAPATFSLALGAAVLWLVLGIGVGLVAATSRKAGDLALSALSVLSFSMPSFLIAVVARYALTERHAWFPDGEYVPFTHNPLEWAWHLLLPWTILASVAFGFYGRVVRAGIRDSVTEQHVVAARARGLSRRRVLMRHVLRNTLLPVVTLFGLDFAALLGGGAILIESIFDLKGIGAYVAGSIGQLDLPPLMGVTLWAAFFIVVFSTVVDLLYARLDPRVRVT